MKICMLVTSNIIKDPRVQKEAELASSHGYDVTVLGRRDEKFDQTPLQNRPYKVVLSNVIRKDDDGLIKRIKERLLIGVFLYKKSVQLKPDIIHANDFDTLPFAWLAARKLKCSVVYDSHEIWSENGAIASYPIAKKVVQFIEYFLARRVNQVVSVSNSAADKLAEMYGIRKPLVVTNCPYSCSDASGITKSSYFEVVYQGIYGKDRGYEELVLSAREIDSRVHIVLRGYGPIESELRRLVEENALEDKVDFATPVDVSELCKAAASSHVGVVLTKPVSINYEYTVSNKIFEYLNAGLPVILSNVKEHKYLVDKYGFGIIVEEVSPKEISKAIMKLMQDKSLYNQLRDKAVESAKELCWEKEGLKLMECYKRIYNLNNNINTTIF